MSIHRNQKSHNEAEYGIFVPSGLLSSEGGAAVSVGLPSKFALCATPVASVCGPFRPALLPFSTAKRKIRALLFQVQRDERDDTHR